MTTSGKEWKKGVRNPMSIGAMPSSRHFRLHRHSQQRPKRNSASPQPGVIGTAIRAAGQRATVSASQMTPSTPQPMTSSAQRSRCNGISRTASSPAGITQSAVIGTASRLATTKNGWIDLSDEHPAVLGLTATYHNLVREWAEL